MASTSYPTNDPNESSLVTKVITEIKSVFGFREDIIESLIDIGRNSDTADKFSLGLKEILPKLPLKYAFSIFDTVCENFPPKPKNPIDPDFPEVDRIYSGRVTSAMKFACFVKLDGFGNKVQGMVSYENIGDGSFTNVSLSVKPGQNVFVKVLSVSNKNCPILSMKAVNQKTGKDLETETIEIETLSEIVRIELNDEEPEFLRGESQNSGDIPPARQQGLNIMTSKRMYCLGALDEEGKITRLGSAMAEFPVLPVLSRILLAGVDFRCSYEALTLVAMIGTGRAFYHSPKGEEGRAEAGRKRAQFFRPEGDHVTMLSVFEAWKENGYSSQWCLDNFVQYESLRKAKDSRYQLSAIMNRLELEIVSADKNYTIIRKTVTAGLFFQAARWDPQEGCYRAVIDDRTVHIHSNSSLFRDRPSWVVYNGLVVTGDKEYMIGVTPIDPKWLLELAPRFVREVGPTRTTMSQC